MTLPTIPEEERWQFQGNAPHVVINTKVDGGRFDCRNCGTVYQPNIPCPLNLYLDMANGFHNDHKNCEIRTEGRLGPAEPPAEEEDDEEEAEPECETCGGERTVESERVCGNTRRGGCADGLCGGCYNDEPCPDCTDADEFEPDWDAMREAREENDMLRAQDEVEWESPE